MKTKVEILEILRREKPELARRYGLKRLAPFGSYARADQREDSEVDILGEIEPQIGLRCVELAAQSRRHLAFALSSCRAAKQYPVTLPVSAVMILLQQSLTDSSPYVGPPPGTTFY
jgi:predicted nucleotidyltransferase